LIHGKYQFAATSHRGIRRMSPQIRALVWKEWRERRTSLYLGITWILFGLVYTIVYEVTTGIRGPVGGFYSVCLVYGLFGPIFLAMRTALGERTQGTLGFSSSLPTPVRQRAAVRVLGALITLVGPIALGAVMLSLVLLTGAIEQSGLRMPHDANYVEFEKRISLTRWEAVGVTWQSAAIAAGSASELLLILSVIGVRRRSESHLGFIGAVLALAWILPTEMLDGFRDSSHRTAVNWLAGLLPQSLAISWGYGTPHGDYVDLEFASLIWGPLCLNLLVVVGLCVWFTHRFAGAVPWMSDRKSRINWRFPPLLSRLPLRLPGRTAALVWLDLRQSVPMAIAGLALAFLMSVAQICLERHTASLPNPYGDPSVTTIAFGRLAGSTWIVATLWSAVVGSGIFGAELQPGLSNFWRSRPVAPSMWFWTKFTVGLVATLIVLDGITIAVSWNSPYASGPDRMSWSYVACMPLLHALFYAVTVFAVCSLRRPVLGAACAVLAGFLLSMFLETLTTRDDGIDPIIVYNNLFQAETRSPGYGVDLSAHHYPMVYGGIAVLIVVAAFGAARFVRRFPAVRA
jgi:ABC-type transport system involved in multi-copper enzyme maturation permease subunit